MTWICNSIYSLHGMLCWNIEWKHIEWVITSHCYMCKWGHIYIYKYIYIYIYIYISWMKCGFGCYMLAKQVHGINRNHISTSQFIPICKIHCNGSTFNFCLYLWTPFWRQEHSTKFVVLCIEKAGATCMSVWFDSVHALICDGLMLNLSFPLFA